MNENKRTKKEIIDELTELRRDITGLESTAARYKHYEEELERQQRAFKIHFDFEEEIAHLQMNHIVGEALTFIKDRTDISRVSIAMLDKEQEGFRLLDVREDGQSQETGLPP
jgi:hypothetical protein